MFLCFKFIIKEFKIYWFQLQKDQSKDIKSDNIKHLVFMSKDLLSIM